MTRRFAPAAATATVALFFALSGAAQAAAPTITLSVVNRAGAAGLPKVERAIVAQSEQLQAAWGTPIVQFRASGGWPIYLIKPDVSCDGLIRGGCHLAGPTLYVSTGFERHPGPTWYSYGFSHEVLEALVDPGPSGMTFASVSVAPGFTPEICDPLPFTYRLKGVRVADFAFPTFYESGTAGLPLASSGPYDQARHAQYPQQQFDTGNGAA